MINMVKNPDFENFDNYYEIYSRNPYPYAALDRISSWALDGELYVISTEKEVQGLTRDIVKKPQLRTTLRSLIITSHIYGDAYARIVYLSTGDIYRYQHFYTRDVEIMTEGDNVIGYEVNFGDQIITYEPHEILHLQHGYQKGNPYGISAIKGIEEIVSKENEIMYQLPLAMRGLLPEFKAEQNLSFLKLSSEILAKHFEVPIGVLTYNIDDQDRYDAEVNIFEDKCAKLRDQIRSEVYEKILKKLEKDGVLYSIGWKRKYKPDLKILRKANEDFKKRLISPEEFMERVNAREYFV